MSEKIESLIEQQVVESSEAHSQVFNLCRLNGYLNPKAFRLVNQGKVPGFLQEGDFMGKLDLSQTYFHILIIEGH